MNDTDILRITVDSVGSSLYIIDIVHGGACFVDGRHITDNPILADVLSSPSHSSSITVRLGTRELTLTAEQHSEFIQSTLTTLYDKYSETTITIRDRLTATRVSHN